MLPMGRSDPRGVMIRHALWSVAAVLALSSCGQAAQPSGPESYELQAANGKLNADVKLGEPGGDKTEFVSSAVNLTASHAGRVGLALPLGDVQDFAAEFTAEVLDG